MTRSELHRRGRTRSASTVPPDASLRSSRGFLIAAAVLAAACGPATPRHYDNNDLELVAAYAARDVCSCRFVMEQGDAFCAAWIKASPEVGRYSADLKAKTVEASALLVWSASARHVGEHEGCVLE